MPTKKPTLQQLGGPLRQGDIIRILDADNANHIAVCVQSDGHAMHPYCCMVLSDTAQARDELWPVRYKRLGNVVELVGVLEDVLLRRLEVQPDDTRTGPVHSIPLRITPSKADLKWLDEATKDFVRRTLIPPTKPGEFQRRLKGKQSITKKKK